MRIVLINWGASFGAFGDGLIESVQEIEYSLSAAATQHGIAEIVVNGGGDDAHGRYFTDGDAAVFAK